MPLEQSSSSLHESPGSQVTVQTSPPQSVSPSSLFWMLSEQNSVQPVSWHGVHSVAPCSEYEPASHSPVHVLVVSPVVAP
jgi:hypothetical protein